MKKSLFIIMLLVIMVSPFFAAIGKLKVTDLPGNVSSVSIDGKNQQISKLTLQGGFLSFVVLQGNRTIVITVPGKKDFVSTVNVGKNTTIKASFVPADESSDSTVATNVAKTDTTKPATTGSTTVAKTDTTKTTTSGSTTVTKTDTTKTNTTKTDTTTVASSTAKNVATQYVSYPFKVGAKFDVGSGIGDFNGYYTVTKSQKKADDNYYFEMTWYEMTTSGYAIKAYIKGTWDHGYVELKKRNKNDPEWYVRSAECFNMTTYYFNAFLNYVELHDTKTLIFSVRQLPKRDDFELFIDGQRHKTFKCSYFDIDMPIGVHDIKVRVPGYEDFMVTVDVTHEPRPGDLTYDPDEPFHVLKYNPKKGKQSGSIIFAKLPNNSSIYIDGKKDNGAKLTKTLESSMQESYKLKISEIPVGDHTFRIVSPGYEDYNFSDYIGKNGFYTENAIMKAKATIKTVPYFVHGLASSDLTLFINGKQIKDYKQAYLNANEYNNVELYKDGERKWIKCIFADSYNTELTNDDIWSAPRIWKVRGVPSNVEVYFGEGGIREKAAKIGNDCYFITDNRGVSKVHIEAEKNGKINYSANLYYPDEYNIELVVDRSLVNDKYLPGDLYYGKDGKACGVVFYTTDAGKHGKIISFAETVHPFVVDDGRRYGTVYYAHNYAYGATKGSKPYQSLSSVMLEEHPDSKPEVLMQKYYPALYYANKFNGGGYNDWYLPSKEEADYMVFIQDIVNKSLKNSGNNVLDLENKSYSLSECGAFMGVASYMTKNTNNRYIREF